MAAAGFFIASAMASKRCDSAADLDILVAQRGHEVALRRRRRQRDLDVGELGLDVLQPGVPLRDGAAGEVLAYLLAHDEDGGGHHHPADDGDEDRGGFCGGFGLSHGGPLWQASFP
ncbi:MAG: hypothetical protein WDN72_02760 [Alphaproteobacteria bacterium]